MNVMPQVHYRIIEDVLQWTICQVNISVIQVPDRNGYVEDDECLFWIESTQEHHSDVLHWSVEYVFHPVVNSKGTIKVLKVRSQSANLGLLWRSGCKMKIIM